MKKIVLVLLVGLAMMGCSPEPVESDVFEPQYTTEDIIGHWLVIYVAVEDGNNIWIEDTEIRDFYTFKFNYDGECIQHLWTQVGYEESLFESRLMTFDYNLNDNKLVINGDIINTSITGEYQEGVYSYDINITVYERGYRHLSLYDETRNVGIVLSENFEVITERSDNTYDLFN